MGIRETINDRQGLAVGAVTGLIVLSLGFVVWYVLFSGGGHSNAGLNAKAFFTDDDGKSFFMDDAAKTPPFPHSGKQAYGCTVFSGDGGKTKFVGWLTRYTDEGKRRMEEMRANKGMMMGPSAMDCVEVKKPGAEAWVKTTTPRGMEVQRQPKVGAVVAEQVMPE